MSTSERSTTAPLTTWAGSHTYAAPVLHRPTTVDEVQQVVGAARRVRALGTRHSFNDLADSPGALLSLADLPEAIDVDSERRTVRVGGGTRYGTLAAVLHREGWALHNLASLPHISVAGAVATATHGSGDRLPNLSAAVRGLELVTADGRLLNLGADHPSLAGAVVSLGALGVVVAVTLAVEPTYDMVQEVHTDLPWSVALEHLDQITASADSVSLFTDWQGPSIGQVWRKSRLDPGGTGWRATDELHGARPATAQCHPVAGVDPRSTTAQQGVAGPWHDRLPHFRMDFTPSHGVELQTEYLVPRDRAAEAIEAVRELGPRIAPLLLVSEIRTVASDDLWLSTAYRQDSVGLHFTWQQRRAEVEALLPSIEQALAPVGPRPHWGKLFTATGAGSPEAIGARYPRLDDFRRLARELDPEGVFGNDYLVRHGVLAAR
ncbi:FAD-binding protein [Actinotalea sp. K2]|uniref:FAD-binding protein n=1 Tax=Actinotalea sp. K2 TaxID=2939438 RepID=UPI0020174395|nr:FAD-binding protein [Actinotalea sp. K2]MCL3861319.1 FAD-binding protein [Actinotalea sp. K2]